MTKKYYPLIVLLFAVLFARAQEKLSNNMFQKKLPNGLTVLVVEDHSVPLATLHMTFKAGAFMESDDINGLIGIYTAMLLKGNKDHPTEQSLGYYSGQLGMKLENAATSQESARLYFTLPKSNFLDGLSFLNSAVRFANVSPPELEREKEISGAALKQKQSNPFFSLVNAIDHHLWGDLYSRKSAIGNPEIINSATPDVLRAIKDKYYYPNNALLIIAGDIEHDEAFKETEKTFADWKPSDFDPLKKWPVPEFKPLAKPDYFIVESSQATSPSIAIYWQGPDTRTNVAATYAADIFSYIINQNSSTLNKALVQSGLATDMHINYLTCKYTGPISLIVTPNPAKVKECMDEVKRQIALMDNDDYITQEQIETAKRTLEIKKIRQEEITTDYVQFLSFWWAAASINYYMGYNNNLEKTSKADIKNYIQRYIKNRPYCAALLINPDLRVQINADDFFKYTN